MDTIIVLVSSGTAHVELFFFGKSLPCTLKVALKVRLAGNSGQLGLATGLVRFLHETFFPAASHLVTVSLPKCCSANRSSRSNP